MTKEQENLIIENHNLIYQFMKQHNMYFDAVEDWYGLCAIGLCNAALLFDPSKGFKFSTFAYVCMKTSCLRTRMSLLKESQLDICAIKDMNAFNEVCADMCYDPYVTKEFQIFAEDMLSKYKEKTQKMLRLKLYNDYSFVQIGQLMGCSKQCVQQKWSAFVNNCRKVLELQ